MERFVTLLFEISVQTMLVAVLVWVLSRLLYKSPAAWRYALWIFVLIKFFIPPMIHVPPHAASHQQTVRPMGAVMHMVSKPVVLLGPMIYATSTFSAQRPEKTTPLVAIGYIWLAGLSLMALRVGIRYRRQARFFRSTVQAEGELIPLLQGCALRFGMRRWPQMRLSADDCPPMLSGLFRPTIILPMKITESCSESDIAAILMHELAHFRRRDNAGRWLIELAQALFFFHPAIWLAAREMGREGERACDELVLSETGMKREEYASGYVSALKLANAPHKGVAVLAMAEPFDIEKRRLSMILNNAVPKKSRLWLGVLLLLMIASLPSFALAVAESSSVTAPPPLKPTETLKTPASPLSPALQKSEGSAGTIGGEAVTPALVAASMAESGHSVMSPESLIAPAIPTGKPTTVEPSARVTPPVSASESVSIKVERFVISAAEAKRLRAPDGRTGHSTSPAGNLQLALPDPKVLESVRLAHGDRLTNSPMIITSINVPATVRYGMAGKGPEGYTDVTFTPTVINPDKSITMSIYVYASVQGAFVTGPDGKTLPTIHSIGITAMVRVQNGETFAIFYQNEDKTDNETMLLVTPSIITTPLSGPAHIGLGGGTSGRGTGNH